MRILETPRLIAETWEPEDLPAAQALWGDPEVTKLIGGPFSETQVKERLLSEIARQNQYQMQYWKLIHKSSNQVVGCCGLRPLTLKPLTHELGFHLMKAFW